MKKVIFYDDRDNGIVPAEEGSVEYKHGKPIHGPYYLASEVDALLAKIKLVAYGSTVWRDVDDLVDGPAPSANEGGT
jgi:hypothetical protein